MERRHEGRADGSWLLELHNSAYLKPCPEQATEKEKFEYDWRKQRCYTTIYQGIERKFLPLIRHTTDGKEAWNILKTNFEPTSKVRLAVLIDEFFELKFNPEQETIGIFCKRVDEKKTQVKEAGFEIPELLIALQLIRRLPAEYDHLVQTLYRLKDEELNHREVEKELVNEAGRIQLKQKDLDLDYTENAYTVGSFRLQETRKKSSEHSGAVLDPSRNPGQYRKISYPKGMGSFCDFCSRKGHDASKCYKKRNKEKKQAFASETSFCRTNQAFGVSTDWDQFLIDTAATSHFCYERDWFKNFKELTTTKALLADKKSTCEVKGIGDIDFIVKDIKGNVKITLKDIFYTPNMRRNLISGARMDIAGLKIIWSNNVMRICHSKNEYFFSAFRQDMLYIVSGYPLLDSVMYTSVDLNLIHKRLCHVDIPIIKDMCKNKSVKGLEKVNIKIDNESCIACNVGKATRTSLKKNNVCKRVTKSVLDKVYMDLWGPAPVNSLGGSKYFLSIIDDFSRKIDVFTLKSKSQVFSIFKEYLSRVQRELGRKLKSVRTDNGMEFCHKDFETFLRDLGIRIERTSFYTQELNGIAERFNRSSMEAVRTMLQDSGLQPRFWAEALHAYVHTKNRCSHKLTEGKTPMEIWSGHKPSTYHHWTIVVDILNYMFNTMYYKINLSDTHNTRLTMYSDSSWGCKLNDRHSTSGYIMVFGNVPITWKSQKQKCIALSSMEAEFISLTESAKCIIWYSKILKELNLIDFRMPELYCDNQAAIHFSKNNIENSKTKHIDIKYKFVRKLLYDKEFELNYLNSKKNLADFLTKPVVKEKFLSVIKAIFQKDSVTDGAECWRFK
ncbi:Retrovirus-related Pol polyprotein from transposon TNT 1-94 [Araneus ventricosus]|uniref:Retrovirus-related Pol polyprotein from transposon TNT 1-94 n=1 Tax=Araneus ventricosus TaxID=182803 RepID=A0A4Y2EUD0_ARAVE|nr:Retrovirus-related Pol polyprotein from transposon TNT 1-94 [Araneus ventricosus]